MLTHALDVVLQITLLVLGCLGIDILLVGHERDLRVDDGILSLRIVEDDVGLHLTPCLVVLQRATELIAQTGLHLVVDTLGESLRSQEVAQNNLTHIAAHLIVATQHVGQTLGLLAQLLGLLHHLDHLLTERGRVGSTLLLVLIDGLLHVGDGILQGLCDARHGLCVRLLQFRGTALQHLLGHRHKLGIALLLFLLFLVAHLFYLLAHQFQFPTLCFGLGVQLFVLHFQMAHAAGGIQQLFGLHRELDIFLTSFDTEHVHLTVHQQVEHDSPYCHTYYNIYCYHHIIDNLRIDDLRFCGKSTKYFAKSLHFSDNLFIFAARKRSYQSLKTLGLWITRLSTSKV